jgi:hypothetical protein
MATAALASTVACSKCGSGTTGGYAVVDPMPTPARCYGGGVVANARWVAKPGGGRLLEIDVSASSPGYTYSAPRVQGGTLLASPAPFPVAAPPPPMAGVFAVPTTGDASTDAARDASATEAGTTTSALGPTTGTFRVDPTSPTVHLVFDVVCPGATATTTVTVSSGRTKDGGEELVTTVNES